MAKKQIKEYVFTPGIGALDNAYPAAYDLLSRNKSFLLAESIAYINQQIISNVNWDPEYTYNQAKCERDLGYVIDAYLYDLRYGGNERLRNTIKYYWDGDVAQVDGNRIPEIDTHAFIGSLITDYVLKNIAWTAQGTVSQTLDLTKVSETAYYTPTTATYTPSTGVMTLTIGTHGLAVGDKVVIAPSGLTFTCALDNNATTHSYPRATGVPNATGRDPYYNTGISIVAVTSTSITLNVGISSNTSVHTFVSADVNSVIAGAESKLTTLVQNTVNVITDGLSSMPVAEPSGVGKIKIQGRYESEDLLLITNTTRNEIIYNFSLNATGGSVEIKTYGADSDFVTFLQTTDAITTITLNYNTSLHEATDNIQIFVENKEVITRPYDFGSDAIERNRVAQPQSMLDADFEYGLQPTKWAAIGVLRGYPSIYEIPGTDTEVVSVTTDASIGTEGVGASLITVTTVSPHGFTVGSPITLKAFEDAIVGAARAEGSFIINTVPTPTTLTYFAKAKVGTENEQVLSTSYTQLRKAGFYTGSNIGRPSVTVISNGSSGEMTTELGVLAGSTIIPFDGVAPELGSPLSNLSIALGTQVTTVRDTSAGGGLFATLQVTENVLADTNIVSVDSTVGIVEGLATDRGDGYAIYVSDVDSVGNTLEFSGNFVSSLTSTSASYTNISGTNISSSGSSATFDISSTGTPSYGYVVGIASGGIDYQAGDRILVSGALLGGLTPANDAIIIVTGIDALGAITTVTGDGVAFNGELSLTVSPTVAGGAGTNGSFNVTYLNGVYTTVTPVVSTIADLYKVGDVVVIPGSVVSPSSGVDEIHDLVISVSSLQKTFTNVVQTATSGSGTSAAFNITASAGAYSATVANGGTDYAVNNTITVAGTQLNGTAPANTATLTATQVTVTYTAAAKSYSGAGTLPVTFDISKRNGSYVLVVPTPTVAPGTGLTQGATVVISGANLGGADTVNDLTFTINVNAGEMESASNLTGTATTSGTGSIFAVTISGTAAAVVSGAPATITFAGTAPSYSNTFASVDYTTNGVGTGAVIDVELSGGTYSVTFINQGIDFQAGNTITVLGANIGGATPANNLTITVSTVGGTGNILTFTNSGAGLNGTSLTNLTGTNRIGTGATFNVTTALGVYTVTQGNPGTGYGPNQQFIVAGNTLAGSTPTNDLTITIDTVDDLLSGVITAVTESGVAVGEATTYLAVSGTNQQNTGTSATFNVTRSNGAYSLISTNSSGTGYKPGNRIVISGSLLDGGSPNDIQIYILSVTGEGGINTFSESWQAANAGTPLDLISTVSITEATIANMDRGFTITYSALATLQINFENAHGLVPGDTFIVTVSSDNGSNNHKLAAGSFFATDIPSIRTLRYQARSAGAITTATAIEAIAYPRPDSFFIHRPFDGGVQLGTGGPQHGAQAIRQSKKYIRYQSGKGIMYTTGALFAPSYDLRSVTSDGIEVGSLITVTTDDNDHGVQIGGVIRLLGIETAGYNSGVEVRTPPTFDYTVVEVVNERTFKVRAQRRLGSTTAVLAFGAQMSVVSWHGATVRSGIFDDQNGIFWEYDGTQISVVQRTGTRQLAGTISMVRDNNVINGTNTRFQEQLKAGDRIIIKGMTHVISHVVSQTQITVTPDWRGVKDIVGTKINLIVDKRIKQSEFNLDRLDGTGPSGYNLDPAKMQMIGIQYSWYGAGFIDYMLRGSNGNFVFCHRIRNSNVNTEAFMRSGNLPVRYEVTNEGPSGQLADDMNDTQTFIDLEDASFFPQSGTLYIDNEIINFEGKSGNRLLNCVRSAPFSNFQAGATRTYTAGLAAAHTARTGVIIISNTITPLISHWGSAFITDGQFDEDRGYLFSYTSTGVNITTTKTTAFLIRLAPSVSNAVVGDLGDRELLNRAQLLLSSLEISSDGITTGATPATITGGIVVEGVLNPQNYPINPSDVVWGGLSGLAQGGQPSFAQIAPGGSINWAGGSTQVLANATVLGTVNGNITVPTGTVYNRPIGTKISYITQTGWTTLGAEVGYTVNDAKFPAGTTITSLDNSPSPVATSQTQINSSARVYDGAGSFDYGAGNTVIRFRRDSWESLVSPATTIGMYYNGSGNLFPFGTRVTAVSSVQGNEPNRYYAVTFSAASTAFFSRGTNISIAFGGTLTGVNAIPFTLASWGALPVDVPVVGQTTNDGKFAPGTAIAAITQTRFSNVTFQLVRFSNNVSSITGGEVVTFNSAPYYVINFSQQSSQVVNGGATIQLTLAPATVNTNTARFTQASWESLVATYGIGTGAEISDAKFPAGARLQTVSALKTFNSTGFYTVTFNQTSLSALAGAATVAFKFGQPPYALPGETVFSFIANPGERSTLDLKELKELTNTPLGGRGTYPNGPDVLAINVYKVAGSAANANIILRWGEAQA